MNLSIILPSPKSPPTYSFGDTIYGAVKISTTEHIEPCESLLIVFVGRTNVSLTRQDADMVTNQRPRYLSQGFLFKRSVLLETRTDVQGPGTSYWPFSFLIPTHADLGLGYDSASPGNLFECESPWRGTVDGDVHSLPPTMCYSSAFQCSVSYALIARFIRPPSAILRNRHDHNATHVIQITQRSNRQNRGPDHHQSSIRSINCDFPLSHSGIADKIGLCAQKMGRLTGWSLTARPASHNGKLSMRIRLPSVIEYQDPHPIPISVSITYSGPEPISDDEQISVTNFTVELVVVTSVRAGMRQQRQNTVLALYKGSFNQTLKHSTSENTTVNDDGSDDIDVNMGTLLRSAWQKHDPGPEFATYNIHRAYHLRTRLNFRVFGQSMVFQKDGIAVEVPSASKAETNTTVPAYSAAVLDSAALEDLGAIQDPCADECAQQPPAYYSSVAALTV